MQNIIIALVVLGGAYWLLRQFVTMPSAKAPAFTRKLGGAACMAIAGFLGLRGAFTVAVPLFLFGLGLFANTASFPWNRKSPGQRSRVRTSLIAMELDHDSGRMEGEVLTGPLKGKLLSSLNEPEMQTLYRHSAGLNDQSRALLEAWLDRNRAGWRERWDEKPQGPSRAGSSAMTKDEARAVLGLKDDATADDIRAAHRRLMKQFHPDHGGSDYLAAKINQAKDVLL
ncbi:MAG: DnaJ domain-containing protein [Parvibaculaceae bacterium]